jgi:hypothetical protein
LKSQELLRRRASVFFYLCSLFIGGLEARRPKARSLVSIVIHVLAAAPDCFGRKCGLAMTLAPVIASHRVRGPMGKLREAIQIWNIQL